MPKQNASIITIDDDLRVEVDQYNYTLQRRSVIQDENSKRYGETIWNTVGHYSSLGGAFFTAVRESSLDDTTVSSIDEFIKTFTKWAAKYDSAYQKAKAEQIRQRMEEERAAEAVKAAAKAAREAKKQDKPKRHPTRAMVETPPKKKMKKVKKKKRRNPSRA